MKLYEKKNKINMNNGYSESDFINLFEKYFQKFMSSKKRDKEALELYRILSCCQNIILGFDPGCISKYWLENIADKYFFVNIGDGKRAQSTHVLKYLNKNIESYSIDPLISEEYMIQGATFKCRFEEFKCRFEEFKLDKTCKIPVLLFQHSHIYIYKCLDKFINFEEIIIADLPCCIKTSKYVTKKYNINIDKKFEKYPETPSSCYGWKIQNKDIKEWLKNVDSMTKIRMKRKNSYNYDILKNWNEKRTLSKTFNSYHNLFLKHKTLKNVLSNKIYKKLRRTYDFDQTQFHEWSKTVSWEDLTHIPFVDEFIMSKAMKKEPKMFNIPSNMHNTNEKVVKN